MVATVGSAEKAEVARECGAHCVINYKARAGDGPADDGRYAPRFREGDRIVKLYNPDNTVLMTVTALERQDDRLVIRGAIFGSMPITARLHPAERRERF